MLEKLDVDFRRVWMREPINWQPVAVDEQTEQDEWGMLVKRVGNAAWFVNEPLAEASIEDLDRYAWPDPADPGRIAGLADEAQSLYANTPYAISVRQATPGIFELVQRMRGPANFMMDLAADVEFVKALVNKVNEIRMEFLRRCLNAVGPYVQMVEYADDFGSQAGPLISPKMFAEIFLPAYQAQNALDQAVGAAGPRVHALRRRDPNADSVFHRKRRGRAQSGRAGPAGKRPGRAAGGVRLSAGLPRLPECKRPHARFARRCPRRG